MTDQTTPHTISAAQRVLAYIERRAPMRGIDKEVIHSIDDEHAITISDLRELAASAPVAPTQPGFALVPLKFVRGFNTLAHNYSLRAEPPEYYRGVEGDAFSNAYARCGRDLAELSAMLKATNEAAPVAPTQPASITLDFKQATELLDMYGGEPTEVTLQVGNGHSGKGVYAHWAEIPEEGAMFLGVSDYEAAPEAAPVAPAPQQGEYLPLSPEGWKWMTHPSRFDGLPIPVRVFTEDEVTYYQPFDEASSDFEWGCRDSQWREISAPLAPSVQDAEDAARWREAINYVGGDRLIGVKQFVIRGLSPVGNLMQGSVAQHFTQSIDEAIKARALQEGGA